MSRFDLRDCLSRARLKDHLDLDHYVGEFQAGRVKYIEFGVPYLEAEMVRQMLCSLPSTASWTNFKQLLTQVVQDHNAPIRDMRVVDIWMGEGRLETAACCIADDEMSTFLPIKLNLFHITLTDVIYNKYPLYTLFMRQCYWFANMIYSVAQIIDNNL